ncbi:MAG: AAA family ATPase [Thiolinea sp.]
MLTYPIKIEGLKGVGSVELSFQEDQQVFALIGANGIGKTKTLEALFQVLIFSHKYLRSIDDVHLASDIWVLREIVSKNISFKVPTKNISSQYINQFVDPIINLHSLPVVFLASQNRGFIQHSDKPSTTINTLENRRSNYFKSLFFNMKDKFSSLNMDVNIEQWFITLAQSSNPYQKSEDNREIEIKVVLGLLNKIDPRIDSNFMQISGDGRVALRIDGQLRELSQLSTGFASILKILQAIISGYSYFTNESRLQQVKGFVLIDEIESHLHLAWQAKIIPLLKQLFPNTTFYITTHSSVVLSPLKDGEAYRLERDADGVVRTKEIKSPSKASLVDVLKDAFDIDVNQIKLENTLPSDQQVAKQQLLDLLG